MKPRKLKIRLATAAEFLDSFEAGFERMSTRKAKPKKTQTSAAPGALYFEDLSVFSKVFTPERLRLLATVRLRKPATLLELAALLKRDYPNVYNDARFLAEQGILRLERRPGRGRGQVKPSFEWEGFDIAV